MNKNSILLIDPDFDPKQSEQLSLWLKIGTDTFSYAILNQVQKRVYAVYDEQECESGYLKLTERLNADPYLNLDYKDVKVAAQTENLIAIPNELFSQDNVSLTAAYFADADSDHIYVQPIVDSEFTSIFSLPKLADKTIEVAWPSSHKLPQHAGLVNLAKQFTADTLVIDFTVKSFEAVYFKAQRAVFQKGYQFDDIEELTYYLLLVVNQLSINTSTTGIKVCGIIHADDDRWNCLTQYFNKVEFLTLKCDLDTTILEDMPAHYYTSLLSLYSCG